MRRSTTSRGRSGGREPRGGYDFGWDVFEGRSRYEDGNAPGHVPPVIAHRQSGGFCSIIGGYVIRDPSLRGTRYSGRYVYGDLCNPELRLAFLKRGHAPTKRDGAARGEPRLVRRRWPGKGLRCVDRRNDRPNRTGLSARRATAALAATVALLAAAPAEAATIAVTGSKSCYRALRRADPDRHRVHGRTRR